MKHYELSGPFFKYSSPYGKVHPSMNRNQWFLSRKLTKKELASPKTSEISKIIKSKCLGVIVRYDSDPKRYIIEQLFPAVSFGSLPKAINYLKENENKLVFCS